MPDRHKTLVLCENINWRSKAVSTLSQHNLQCFAPRDVSNLESIKASLPEMKYVFWVVDQILADYTAMLDALYDHWPNTEHIIILCQLHSNDLQVHCKRTLLAKVAHCYLTGLAEVETAIQKVLYEFFPSFAPTRKKTSVLEKREAFVPSFTKQSPSTRSSISQQIKRNLQRKKLIVVASSTGGVQALTELLTAWPNDLTAPIIIAHHLPAKFQTSLQEILQRVSHRNVSFITEETKLDNAVYISPFDYHVRVFTKDGHLWAEPHQGPKEHFLRPAADPLFRSAGDLEDTRVIAVVLTGMGRDGMAGAKHIHSNGGHVICQDEASSVVWGMPKQVFDLGITEGAYPPKEIGRRVVTLCK